MSVEESLFWGQHMLVLTLQVCGPPLMAALVVGLTISLLQAVTQVNEMTLVFIPKILAVFFVLWVLGDWMLQHTVAFGTMAFQSAGMVQ